MARIFTIDFEYKGAIHAALVSTWKTEMQSDVYQISLNDEALSQLVPDGIVRFTMPDTHPVQKGANSEELVYCLKKAVAGHLQGLTS